MVFSFIKSALGHPTLDPEQRAKWDEDGYLVLKSFFAPADLMLFERELQEIIANHRSRGGDITIDMLAGPQMGKRLRLRDAPDDAFDYPHKINDLYLESQACRDLALNTGLCRILGCLIGGRPMIINSLCFIRGSQQPHHFDTYYMPPPVANRMVVSSICLEDQSEAVGPLSYYPGSHRIPPYRFSHGGIHAIEEEMDAATSYVHEQIDTLGLKKETFVGKAGDVFIWHGQLYHGGLQIKDESKTRKTLVTHYWREGDVQRKQIGRFGRHGSYLKRDHPPV